MRLRVRLCLASLTAALGLAVGCHRLSVDDHVRKAQTYLEQSQFSDAIFEYRLALDADPRRGDIRLKLAQAYVQAHDLANAIGEYVRAADLLPNDAGVQVQAGNALLVARAFDDAKARAKKALALDPTRADAEILLGNAQAGLRDLDGAISDYQEAVALNPSQANAYDNIGTIQLARGQAADAEASFRKAIAAAPKSVEAHMALANFLWSSGRPAEAEQSLKAALALDPGNLAANRALGVFYLTSNRPAEAEPYFQAIAAAAKTSAAKLGLADFYIVVHRLDPARRLLEALAQQPATYAEASTRLAGLDAIEGQRAQALARIKDVIAKYPADSKAHLLRAQVLVLDGKRDEALAEADIATTDPNPAGASYAYLLIGRVQASLDRQDDAVRAYQEVLKRQARPLDADLGLAVLYCDRGQLDQATTYLQQARTIQPGNSTARAISVRILIARGELDKAAAELATLRKDFPNSPTVLDLVGEEEVRGHQLDAARASFEKAAQLAPGDLEALEGLVQVDLLAGRNKDAVSRIEAAEKKMAPTATFLILAGRTYEASGDMNRAEDRFKKAIEAEPARLRGYIELGTLYARQKRVQEAEAQFSLIVQRTPDSVSANTMLGMLFEAEHRLPDAEKQYQKVLGFDARAAVAANNLAWLYVDGNRNLDEALRLARSAVQQMPDDPHVTDTLGWTLCRKNMPASAIPYLEASIRKDPSDPTVHFHLGMAYNQAGQFEKAKKALQHALASNTNFDGIDEARRTLAQIGS